MNLLPWLSLSSDLNPTENEWGELKRSTIMELWIWRIWSDSGWRNGLWSLVMCSLTSSVIIGENSELLPWESIYFCNEISPHFQLFYLNDRWEFYEFFEWKIKRINNADLFHSHFCSHLPRVPILLEGTVCIYIYIYIYIYTKVMLRLYYYSMTAQFCLL